jgi:hypothetical protein
MTTYNKAYPLLPQMAYKKTSIDMPSVIAYIKSLQLPIEVKRSTYVIFRTESGNGQSGINNNFCGFQSDGDKFPNKYSSHFVGYCIKTESRTGKSRGFLCFDKWQSSIDILSDEILNRGLYIGGKIDSPYVSFTDVTAANICQAYEGMWVEGDKKYIPTKDEQDSFNSMYKQAVILFS